MKFMKGAKIYFGRSHFSFAGIVIDATEKEVQAAGVELGCLMPKPIVVTIACQEGLQVMEPALWAKLTEDEPAFADTMALERFAALQRELEDLIAEGAAGNDTEEVTSRVILIEKLMEASPWTLHPDYGCISKKEAVLIGALEEISSRAKTGGEDMAQFCHSRAESALKDAAERKVMP